MSMDPLSRIAQGKLRPVDENARKELSKGLSRGGISSVKCPFCDEFVPSNKLRLHFRDFHPRARRGNSIVCEKCGLQISNPSYSNHSLKCQGDKESPK